MPQLIRLAPSGPPIGYLGLPGDGIPFQRRFVASWNTVVYRPPALLGLLQGPANENPALFGFSAPAVGWYQVQLRHNIQLRWANPKGAPGTAQSNTGTIALQVSEDGGANWIAPRWTGTTAAASNGQHIINRTVTATIWDDSIGIAADHIWQATDVNVPLLCRVAWTATQDAGFDVYSSYVDENNPSGGWSFEGHIAEWFDPTAP